MKNLRKYSPMFRAVGVIGVVAGLVTAVTFANLTSDVVALDPNNLEVASASLVIDAGGTCGNVSPTTEPGLQATNLAPGDTVSKAFCIRNTGDVPVTITGTVSAVDASGLNASLAAQATTLTIECGADAPISGALNTGWVTTFPTPLDPATTVECTADALLSSSFGGSGGDVIPEFKINFVGTQVIAE